MNLIKIPNILWFQHFKCEDLLLFSVFMSLKTEYLSILNCMSPLDCSVHNFDILQTKG